jgi:predicted HicB family RNase H-like nuclease
MAASKKRNPVQRRSGTAIRFKPETHEALTLAAAERDLSVNYLVNRAVEDYLRRLIPADELTLVRPTEVPK